MATLDMIKMAGGEPANFLDVGGGASPERVLMSFQAVLNDPKVEAILVNIFAGINRCDWIAEGVIRAVQELELTLPVVVRLSGTNVDEGRRILAESGLDILTAETLAEAGEKVVSAWKSSNVKEAV
ncbi:MAG: succinate--CoA ligase subunit beta, partial [Roseovarius sp.]